MPTTAADRAQVLARGLCVDCRERPHGETQRCEPCRQAHRERCRRRYEGLAAAQICQACGVRRTLPGRTRCGPCAAEERHAAARLRRGRRLRGQCLYCGVVMDAEAKRRGRTACPKCDADNATRNVEGRPARQLAACSICRRPGHNRRRCDLA